MPFVNLSTGVVHYSENGQGVPLILLHANPGDCQDFEAVIPTLAKKYRVIAIDWPGYGQSDLPQAPESVTALFFYNILREFITALSLSASFYIGNSVGGNVAARLASESPELVLGLVLVSSGGFTPHNYLTRAFCHFQGSRLSLSPHRFASMYLKHQNSTTKAMLQRSSNMHKTSERILLNRTLWRSFAQPVNDLRQTAKRIKTPTLLLFGKYDPAVPAHKDGRIAAQCIPAGQLVILPCGHASFAEVPELFLAEVETFLAAISG
jgi:pimeloyl-ACP methyl ester carboxylesterase